MENMSIDKFRAKTAGYLLVELLISVAIISGASLFILRYQWEIVLSQNNALQRAKAIDHTIAFLEKIYETKTIVQSLSKVANNYTIEIKSTKLQANHKIFGGYEGKIDNFTKFTVTTRWRDVSGKERSFCIVSGMV